MKLLIKNLIFTVLVPGTVAVICPFIISNGNLPGFRWSTPAGWVLLFVGFTMYSWCVGDFANFGHGTPIPMDAPKRLVVRGLYRYVRNPMYLGVLFVILGWVCLFWNINILLYGLCVAGFFHLLILLYEEPRLLQLFGSEYETYRKAVNRWIPGFWK